MIPRPDHSDRWTEKCSASAGRAESEAAPDSSVRECLAHRLNLLLSHGGWRAGSVVDQLPRLLEPMGIRSLRAESGEEAAHLIRTYRIHIAVVDVAIPLQRAAKSVQTPAPAGPRLLQLLRRLEQPPPTVVVRPPQPIARENTRLLADALREGAFAVLDWPVNLETMLEVMRRILHRHYSGIWPNA